MKAYLFPLLLISTIISFEISPSEFYSLGIVSSYINDTIPNNTQKRIVPENFEFLDHINKGGQVQNFKLMPNGILFTCDRGLSFEVNLAGYDYTRKNLYTSDGFTYATSKFIEVDDSTTRILLYNLIDYDIGAFGFVQIDLKGDQVEIMDTLVWNENFEYNVKDLEMDTLGNIWCQSYRDKLIKIDPNGSISQLTVSDKLSMYQNGQGQLYFYNNNSLFYFDGESLSDTLISFPYIHDIISFDGNNYLATKEKIIQYNIDFTQEIRQWSIPDVPYPNISITEHGISISSYDIDGSFVILCGADGTCNEVLRYPREEENNESFFTAIANSDSTVVIGGLRHLSDIRITQPILRSVNILSQDQKYDRRNVDVSFFEIKGIGKDTTYVDIRNGDTTIYYNYHYDVLAEIHNRSVESISLCDAFSEPFGFIGNKNKVHLIFDTIVPPNTYVSLQSDFSVNGTSGDQSHLILGIPGADFRINEGISRTVDFSSSAHSIHVENNALIYPNPVLHELTVQHEDVETITIYNIHGQLVYHREHQSQLNPKLDVQFMQDGMYLILVKQKSNKYYSTKFIKESN